MVAAGFRWWFGEEFAHGDGGKFEGRDEKGVDKEFDKVIGVKELEHDQEHDQEAGGERGGASLLYGRPTVPRPANIGDSEILPVPTGVTERPRAVPAKMLKRCCCPTYRSLPQPTVGYRAGPSVPEKEGCSRIAYVTLILR